MELPVAREVKPPVVCTELAAVLTVTVKPCATETTPLPFTWKLKFEFWKVMADPAAALATAPVVRTVPKFTLDVVAMFCGVERVTDEPDGVTVIWLAVPTMERAPVRALSEVTPVPEAVDMAAQPPPMPPNWPTEQLGDWHTSTAPSPTL